MSSEGNRETEVNILRVLLDFEPKNQNEIVDAIGKNKNNSTNRVRISRSIPDLAKYLERRPNRLDENGKRWGLKKEKEILKQIAIKYPELMIDLRRSDSVIEIIKDSVLGPEIKKELTNPFEFSDNIFYIDMTKWFKLSPSFFDYCLNNDYETIKKRWKEYFILNSGHGLDGHPMINAEGKLTFRRDEGADEKAADGAFCDTINEIYEHCVSNDVLNGYSNPEAVEEIRQERKKNIETYKRNTPIERFYYIFAILKNIFPEAKLALDAENNKALDDELTEVFDNRNNPRYNNISQDEYLRRIEERLEKRCVSIHEIVKDMKPDVKNLIGFRFTISDILRQ